jgi:dihydroxyacetone kinase
VLLRAIAQTLGDDAEPDTARVAAAVTTGVQRIRETGGANPGDKTMVDALVPFAGVLAERADAGDDVAVAWAAAADAAADAARATADLVPKLGRSRSHGDKSLGTPDPGAYSFGLIVTAVSAVLEDRENR